MSDPEVDHITAAAVAYVDAYYQWRHAESRLSEAHLIQQHAQEEYDRALTKEQNGKAFLLEVMRSRQT